MPPHNGKELSRPKISTMPRQNTEATAYLDIYKLINEKKRLQKELVSLEQRRDLIQQRLQTIETQVTTLKETADQYETLSVAPKSPTPTAAKTVELGSFNTLFLEY